MQTPSLSHFSQKPSDFLREEFMARKQANRAYSLRAFARDLGMSQPLLSWILNEKRPLTLKQAHKIISLLQFSPSKERKFLELVMLTHPSNKNMHLKIKQLRSKRDASFAPLDLDVEKFRMISRWYHLSILNLATIKGFKSDSKWIAKNLGISSTEARDAVQRLRQLGYLSMKDGALVPTHLHLEVDPKKSVTAIRTYHQQMIEKALQQLKKTDDHSFKNRDFTSISLAFDSSRMPEVKEYLASVREEMRRRFTTGSVDKVCQLNLQFFEVSEGPSDEDK